MVASTATSRNLIVEKAQTLHWVCVYGEQPFRVRPPLAVEAGLYRAELDRETRTATVTREATA